MKQLIKKFAPHFLLEHYRSYRKKKKAEKYIGNKVHCPICNSTFSEFAPFGLHPRKNARCHTCGSLERHRLIWKYLLDKTNLFNSGRRLRLLHFAPEKVFYNKFVFENNIEYVPCDLFPDLFDFAEKTEVVKVDITNIPFENNYFDVVLCNHVLEHIPDDALAMTELLRVMKNDGWAILQVPLDYNREVTYEDFSITSPKEREKAFGQDNHVRWYGQDYRYRLANAGFEVTEDRYVETFSEEELFRFGLMRTELIYYCRKIEV